MKPKQEIAVQTAEVIQTSKHPVVNTPDMLIALGIEKGLSIEQLERLMDMQERWFARIAKAEFLEAKKNFQNDIPVIKKTKNADFGPGKASYAYAPLDEIAEQIKPACYKNGLTYDWKFQDLKDEKGNPKLKAIFIVSHIGGHSEITEMESYYDNSGGKNNIQSMGSTASYLQRYTLIGGFGLTTAQSDVDGKGPGNGPAKKSNDSIPKPKISDVAFKQALIRISKGEPGLHDKLHEHYALNEEQENAIKAIQATAPKASGKSPSKKKNGPDIDIKDGSGTVNFVPPNGNA
jgi:hypothetical protein